MNRKADFKKRNVLVLGDLMLDCYYYGKVRRISPEAPVPIFLKEDTKYVLGGAANVASNLLAANQNVYLCSVIGEDEAGENLLNMLDKIGCDCSGVLSSKKRKTTIKTRLLAQNNQQLIRVDQEQTDPIFALEEELLSKIKKVLPSMNIIIISDYLKGVLTFSLVQEVIHLSKEKKIPIFIDIKDTNFDKYFGATLLKPNRNELSLITGMSTDTKEEILKAAQKLKEKCKCEYVLTTLESRGMFLLGNNIEEWISSTEHEVYDVSGAGDTVISYLAASFINGYGIVKSADIANIAAGIKVRKVGTAPVLLEEVINSPIFNGKTQKDLDKIVTISELKKILKEQRKKKLVFTNGCFDILHRGHVSYLQAAAKLGDLLVVGLNSDQSVKRLKGSDRPINKEEDRAVVLGALDCVNFIVVFDEDTPLNIIKEIKPNVLVKGADYTKEDIVGASFVESYGGEVQLVNYLDNHSTTGILHKIGGI